MPCFADRLGAWLRNNNLTVRWLAESLVSGVDVEEAEKVLQNAIDNSLPFTQGEFKEVMEVVHKYDDEHNPV